MTVNISKKRHSSTLSDHSKFFPDGYRHPFFPDDLQLAVEVVVVLNGQETHRNPALL